jgi:N-acyl homoserine lactone hydrolase
MFTVHPIRCGTLTAPKSALTYRVDRGLDFEFAVFAFLLTAADPDDETVILVDTGLAGTESAYMRGRGRVVGPPGGGPDPLRAALADHGLASGDIETVVMTHLHHDHAANMALFADASFVVQRAEVAAARDPLPIVGNAYIDEVVDGLADLDIDTVAGDETLCNGIDLLHTPGHTEGSQSVLVETPSGPCALIGDLAYNRHNLDPGLTSIEDASGQSYEVTPMDMDYIPPGTHVSIEECYDSIRRLRSLVGESGWLLSSHDPETVARFR